MKERKGQADVLEFLTSENAENRFPTTREIQLAIWPDTKPNPKTGIVRNSNATQAITGLRKKGLLDNVQGGYKARNNRVRFESATAEIMALLGRFDEKDIRGAIAQWQAENF